MSEPPDWVKDYVHVCVEAFGLQEQEIYIRWIEDLTIDEGAYHGFCDPDPRYLRGTIKLDSSLQPDEDGYKTITHEMGHYVQGAQGTVVDRIIALLPAKLQDHAREIWWDATEPTVERTARALTPILRKYATKEVETLYKDDEGVV